MSGRTSPSGKVELGAQSDSDLSSIPPSPKKSTITTYKGKLIRDESNTAPILVAAESTPSSRTKRKQSDKGSKTGSKAKKAKSGKRVREEEGDVITVGTQLKKKRGRPRRIVNSPSPDTPGTASKVAGHAPIPRDHAPTPSAQGDLESRSSKATPDASEKAGEKAKTGEEVAGEEKPHGVPSKGKKRKENVETGKISRKDGGGVTIKLNLKGATATAATVPKGDNEMGKEQDGEKERETVVKQPKKRAKKQIQSPPPSGSASTSDKGEKTEKNEKAAEGPKRLPVPTTARIKRPGDGEMVKGKKGEKKDKSNSKSGTKEVELQPGNDTESKAEPSSGIKDTEAVSEPGKKSTEKPPRTLSKVTKKPKPEGSPVHALEYTTNQRVIEGVSSSQELKDKAQPSVSTPTSALTKKKKPIPPPAKSATPNAALGPAGSLSFLQSTLAALSGQPSKSDDSKVSWDSSHCTGYR